MSTTLETRKPAAPEGVLDLPETRPAALALSRVERAVRARKCPRSLSPLYLHGPPGCGKSFLLAGLLERLGEGFPILATTGRDLGRQTMQPEALTALETAALLVIEDVTTLPATSGDTLATWLDRLSARRVPVVMTAPAGPARLFRHGARLRSRLSGGLVLHVPPPGTESRQRYVTEKAASHGLTLTADALDWLVRQTPGSFRQLAGVVGRLAAPPHGNEPLDQAAVQTRLKDDPAGEGLTVERIARAVGQFYRVAPARLRGKSRQRAALVPRQVGMYLARTLTDLSLDRIGAYFGGRDHATVLHACRKVEQALTDDPGLAGAVQSLRAELC
jgi:chromosomal replication initiator protein